MNFNEFKNKYLGKALDFDGVAGVQCVDLIKFYLKDVFGITAGAWGNAKDYYENYKNNIVLMNNFDRIVNYREFVPKKGDIAVFGSSNMSPYGHICICTGQGNMTFFKSIDMNWGGKEAKEVLHSYVNFLGVLRPKVQSLLESSQFEVRVDKPKACVRDLPSTKTGKIAGSRMLYRGNTFKAIDLVKGEAVNGNNLWYKSWRGNYVWSGGLSKV